MDERVIKALEPAVAGNLVRVLGAFVPGVARTREQISAFRDQWSEMAIEAMAIDQPVLVVLGDSLSQGIGATSIESSYVALVARALRVTGVEPFGIVNLSRSGATTRDVLEVQLPALNALPNRILAGTCTVGNNDLLRSVRVGATKRRFSTLIEQLPASIVMATVPDARSQLAKVVNRHIRAEVERMDRDLADVGRALTSWKGNMASDGFHPNDNGHQLWADTFGDALQLNGRFGRAATLIRA